MVSIVRTTPFIWGRQASETMAMRKSPLLRRHAYRGVAAQHTAAAQPGVLLGPAQDAQTTLEILDEGGAALDPVAVVAIENALDGSYLGVMDVAAYHAVDAAAARLAGDGALVVADVLHGILDAVLQVGRQRPIGQSEPAPPPVEGGVEPECQVV